MADLSDVTAALGLLCQDALYPGQATPAGAAVTTGVEVLIQTGWPDPKSLDARIAANKAEVTIYPLPMERNVTRYPATWSAGALKPKTFTLSADGQEITVAGAPPTTFYRQNVCAFVAGKPYIYSTLADSTIASIASGLAALIAADIPGTSAAGAVVTVADGYVIGALRVGTSAPIIQEVKRQVRDIQIVVWAPTASSRTAIAKLIDIAIAKAPRIDLPDTTRGRLIYQGSPYTDFDQKQGIYRRDFRVSVEYATTNMDEGPEVVAVESRIWIGGNSSRLGTEDGQQIEGNPGGGIVISEPSKITYL